MKKIAVFAIVFLLIAGMGYAKDYEVKKKAGQYDVEVKMDKNPPVVGNNNVSIEIKDESGKHVTDAKVIVDYSMPAMPGMPAMNYKTDATVSDSMYRAVMDLSMSGSWNVTIKIVFAGKTSKMKFTVDAK